MVKGLGCSKYYLSLVYVSDFLKASGVVKADPWGQWIHVQQLEKLVAGRIFCEAVEMKATAVEMEYKVFVADMLLEKGRSKEDERA